jgi:hypothetical protein
LINPSKTQKKLVSQLSQVYSPVPGGTWDSGNEMMDLIFYFRLLSGFWAGLCLFYGVGLSPALNLK